MNSIELKNKNHKYLRKQFKNARISMLLNNSLLFTLVKLKKALFLKNLDKNLGQFSNNLSHSIENSKKQRLSFNSKVAPSHKSFNQPQMINQSNNFTLQLMLHSTIIMKLHTCSIKPINSILN